MVLPLSSHLTYRWHPRSRGVYSRPDSFLLSMAGSSPLARGLRPCLWSRYRIVRIIPARAGFTADRPPWPRRRGDHPRSRGVYRIHDVLVAIVKGSSPLARGLPAGSASTPPPATDHPRSRGVYSGGLLRGHFPIGSSPLARGLLGSQYPRCVSQDHPRSRGVYHDYGPHPRRRGGSSPLARGLRSGPRRNPVRRRIIPARAGFTPMYA